jgi:hypothetical protein
MAALDRHAQSASVFNGCRVLDQGAAKREGVPVLRPRTECSGPSGARQTPNVAKATILEASPNASLVAVVRRIDDARRVIEAAALTTLGTKQRYRVTYWYEIGAIPADSRTGPRGILPGRASPESMRG